MIERLLRRALNSFWVAALCMLLLAIPIAGASAGKGAKRTYVTERPGWS